MASFTRSSGIVLIFFVILHTLYFSSAKEKKIGIVAKKDLKYIGCEVCEKAISGLIYILQ